MKKNNSPLLSECNKGEGHRVRIKKIKERIINEIKLSIDRINKVNNF